jgi:tetratricopeptide (TPR) repeat protein
LFFVALSLLAVLGSDARAQTDPGPGMPTSREAMWPAPTAEDWKKPCLITWQRTWQDALAVSRETGKPILVCVNMDGEIASEHYAGIRYRDPEIAKLYEPYVCVIASVYRHNPRDFDEEGRRILCPRFGSVTCGEHIAIEPGLFKEFFDDKRIAPRHIGVELNGEETYDVYYAFDTDSVFEAIKNGIENRDVVPKTVTRGDRTIVERVASRDIQDRIAVELAYQEGDRDLRRSLLQAAIDNPEAEQVDLLRLAVFGFDMELSRMARQGLAQSNSEAAFKVITEALRVPMEASERDALIGALARIGENSPKAKMHAVVHKGLSSRSIVIDVEAWAAAIEGAETPALYMDRDVLDARIENQNEVFQSKDGKAYFELAEAFLTLAYEQPESEQKYARSLIRDAYNTALEAEKLDADGWRLNAIISLAAVNLDKEEEAYMRAEAAALEMPAGAPEWYAIPTIEVFARARRQQIAQAVRDKRDWSTWSEAFQGTGTWLTDVHAAYSVLERHPLGTDDHVVAHYDFLKVLGATGQASRILDAGLKRFPDSWRLHYRLRGRILREKGVDGLEMVYEALLREKDAAKNLEWYAGYASFITAEFYRRFSDPTKALAAYDRAIAHYERAITNNPESRDTSDHYIALALGGRARIAYEQGDCEQSLAELLASFDRKADAAATLDGLNISPVDTARMLLQKLKDLNRDDLAAQLEAALGKLDPELLELPAYEREGPSRRPGERSGPGRMRRQRGG